MEEAGIFGALALGTCSLSPPGKLFPADPGVIELGCSPGSFLAPCGAYLPGSGTERVGENEEVSISWVIF